MLIRRSQKKRNAEPRQKQNHRSVVIDPMVNPGSSAHRHQARSRADPTRTHHRMVTMAQSSPGDRSACAPQSKTTTVMLGHLVTAEACRSLVGVVNADQKASKGIITTTSDFAPKIKSDPSIAPMLPTRLELMNGVELQAWLKQLS